MVATVSNLGPWLHPMCLWPSGGEIWPHEPPKVDGSRFRYRYPSWHQYCLPRAPSCIPTSGCLNFPSSNQDKCPTLKMQGLESTDLFLALKLCEDMQRCLVRSTLGSTCPSSSDTCCHLHSPPQLVGKPKDTTPATNPPRKGCRGSVTDRPKDEINSWEFV